MSTSMDVDLPSSTTAGTSQGGVVGDTIASIEIHPLAIVHMSDQYTRVTCGGSPLPCDAPVVGLLFGKLEAKEGQQLPSSSTTVQGGEKSTSSSCENKNNDLLNNTSGGTILEIRDAEDIPTEISDNTAQQISLHQAVFPQHHVVGWYRVAKKKKSNSSSTNKRSSGSGTAEEGGNPKEEEVGEDTAATTTTSMSPTEEDLLLTKLLQEHYAKDTAKGGFIFALLQVPSDEEITQSSSSTSSSSDQLPLSVYQVKTLPSASFLYAIENWQLETSEVERIAVERVVREQPQHHHNATSSTDAAAKPSSSSSSPQGGEDEEETSESAVPASSPYATHLTSISTSLEAMGQRLDILVDYLKKINPEEQQQEQYGENGEGSKEGKTNEELQQQQKVEGEKDVDTPEINLEILREIQGLVYQLGAVEAFSEQDGGGDGLMGNDTESLLLSHLGAIAKTICAIQGYTDKFRKLTDSRPMSGKYLRR